MNTKLHPIKELRKEAIEIEKNVPIPSLKRATGVSVAMAQMEVGDSIFCKDKTSSTLAGSITYSKRKTGNKFATRSVDGGVRVWRTA